MKKIILSLLFLSNLTSFAQQKAILKKATVYPRGAVLEHSAKLTLKKGTQTVVLRGLAASVDINSLVVEIDGYVNVLSHKYMQEYKTKTAQKTEAKVATELEGKIEKLAKKTATLTKEIKNIDEQIAIEKKGIDIILANPKTAGTTTIEVTALSDYVGLYKDQAYKSQQKIKALNDKRELCNDSIAKINEKITLLQEEKDGTVEVDSLKNTGYIELQLNSPQEFVASLNFSYFCNNASWNPSYDILSEGIEKDLKIKYKANISQNTGIDWKNVKISVSTAQPNLSNKQPMLSAWYVDVYQGYSRTSEGVYNSVNNEIPSVGNFIPSFDNPLVQAVNVLEESGLNISFDATMNYSISTDNKTISVLLKTIDLACDYKYYTAPKLDKSVFLLAEINDFEQYNFLPGEAQVFYEGKYTGKTLLDPFITTAGINISLGRDNSVVVKREKTKLKVSTTWREGNRIDEYKWKITVKNNHAKDINIIVKDQYPLTINEKITVNDKEHSKGGTLNEENGVVTWMEKISSGQNETFSIGYKVSRPKDMVLAGI